MTLGSPREFKNKLMPGSHPRDADLNLNPRLALKNNGFLKRFSGTVRSHHHKN